MKTSKQSALDSLRDKIREIETNEVVPVIEETDDGNNLDVKDESTLNDSPDDAYQRVIKLCSYKDRSVFQLEQRLTDESYAETAINEAIKKAVSYGIVDDERYARAYVHDALLSGKGKYVIQRNLRKAGIPEYIILDALDVEEMADEAQLERALRILQGKTITAKNKRDAAYRRLIQRGFSSDISARAARMWTEGSR